MASTRSKKKTTKIQPDTRRPFRQKIRESDGQFLLKLVLVVIVATVWIKLGQVFYLGPIPVTGIPIGMIAGLVLVERFEDIQEDRKIWYTILVLVAIASYFLPAGIVI